MDTMEADGCTYAAIFDKEGNKWTESKAPCVQVAPDQIKQLTKSRPTDLQGKGIQLGGKKFMVLHADDNSITMKQLGGDPNNKMMCCLAQFKQGVCVGMASGENEKKSRQSAEKTADYLKSQGY